MYDRGLWRYIRFFENPVDFINSPVYRDGCEFSGIFQENPVGLAGMGELEQFRTMRSPCQGLHAVLHVHVQFTVTLNAPCFRFEATVLARLAGLGFYIFNTKCKGGLERGLSFPTHDYTE